MQADKPLGSLAAKVPAQILPDFLNCVFYAKTATTLDLNNLGFYLAQEEDPGVGARGEERCI